MLEMLEKPVKWQMLGQWQVLEVQVVPVDRHCCHFCRHWFFIRPSAWRSECKSHENAQRNRFCRQNRQIYRRDIKLRRPDHGSWACCISNRRPQSHYIKTNEQTYGRNRQWYQLVSLTISPIRLLIGFNIMALGSSVWYTACPRPMIRPPELNIPSIYLSILSTEPISLSIFMTFTFAPPCRGPDKEPMAAEMAAMAVHWDHLNLQHLSLPQHLSLHRLFQHL